MKTISYKRILKAIKKLNEHTPEEAFFRVWDDGSGGFYYHDREDNFPYPVADVYCFGADRKLEDVLQSIEELK